MIKKGPAVLNCSVAAFFWRALFPCSRPGKGIKFKNSLATPRARSSFIPIASTSQDEGSNPLNRVLEALKVIKEVLTSLGQVLVRIANALGFALFKIQGTWYVNLRWYLISMSCERYGPLSS